MRLWHLRTRMRRLFSPSPISNSCRHSISLNQTRMSAYLSSQTRLTHTIHRALSVDTSGDFIAFKRDFKSNLIKSIILSSLFDIRRAYGLPDVDFASSRGEMPTQPKPVSAGPVSLLSGTLSWFSGGGGITGDQVDELCTCCKLCLLSRG